MEVNCGLNNGTHVDYAKTGNIYSGMDCEIGWDITSVSNGSLKTRILVNVNDVEQHIRFVKDQFITIVPNADQTIRIGWEAPEPGRYTITMWIRPDNVTTHNYGKFIKDVNVVNVNKFTIKPYAYIKSFAITDRFEKPTDIRQPDKKIWFTVDYQGSANINELTKNEVTINRIMYDGNKEEYNTISLKYILGQIQAIYKKSFTFEHPGTYLICVEMVGVDQEGRESSASKCIHEIISPSTIKTPKLDVKIDFTSKGHQEVGKSIPIRVTSTLNFENPINIRYDVEITDAFGAVQKRFYTTTWIRDGSMDSPIFEWFPTNPGTYTVKAVIRPATNTDDYYVRGEPVTINVIPAIPVEVTPTAPIVESYQPPPGMLDIINIHVTTEKPGIIKPQGGIRGEITAMVKNGYNDPINFDYELMVKPSGDRTVPGPDEPLEHKGVHKFHQPWFFPENGIYEVNLRLLTDGGGYPLISKKICVAVGDIFKINMELGGDNYDKISQKGKSTILLQGHVKNQLGKEITPKLYIETTDVNGNKTIIDMGVRDIGASGTISFEESVEFSTPGTHKIVMMVGLNGCSGVLGQSKEYEVNMEGVVVPNPEPEGEPEVELEAEPEAEPIYIEPKIKISKVAVLDMLGKTISWVRAGEQVMIGAAFQPLENSAREYKFFIVGEHLNSSTSITSRVVPSSTSVSALHWTAQKSGAYEFMIHAVDPETSELLSEPEPLIVQTRKPVSPIITREIYLEEKDSKIANVETSIIGTANSTGMFTKLTTITKINSISKTIDVKNYIIIKDANNFIVHASESINSIDSGTSHRFVDVWEPALPGIYRVSSHLFDVSAGDYMPLVEYFDITVHTNELN